VNRDQRRSTGSGITLEACLRRRAIQIHVYLLYSFSLSIQKRTTTEQIAQTVLHQPRKKDRSLDHIVPNMFQKPSFVGFEHLYSPRMAGEIKEGKIGTANEQTVM